MDQTSESRTDHPPQGDALPPHRVRATGHIIPGAGIPNR
jgi:hypothetical protein